MGRSTTPKYALFVSEGRNAISPMSWRVKDSGTPTADNLAKWVDGYHRSLEPGGANAHIAKALGYIPYLTRARITRNTAERPVIAEWTAPMFMAVGPNV